MRVITKLEPTAPQISRRKRVAAYARVSSGKDAQLQSLSAQISYYSDYIQKRGEWEYCGVYADEAFTGTKDERPEFQRLIDDCRNGKLDMVITKSIARFARNTVTMLEVVRELKNLGIDVFFEKENIHSLSGDGELMLTILASYAQEESRSVSDNIKWRIRKRYEQGEQASLRFIFGYNIVKGNIEINEEEAEIVRMIFDDYISGMGGSRIAKKLRELGVATMRDGIWNGSRILFIIKNEKYTGNALLQKKFIADHLTKRQVRNVGQLPQYYAENTHPAIIDMTTFEKAQAIVEQRNRKFGKDTVAAPKRYPFTGRILCENCGKKYKRKTTAGKVYWQCSTFLQEGKDVCHAKQIPEEILHAVTSEALGLAEFDSEVFADEVAEIQIPEANRLIYIFRNGQTADMEWQDRSRADSWTDEMKQTARDRMTDDLRDASRERMHEINRKRRKHP